MKLVGILKWQVNTLEVLKDNKMQYLQVPKEEDSPYYVPCQLKELNL